MRKRHHKQKIQSYLTQERSIDTRLTVFAEEETGEPINFEQTVAQILAIEKLKVNEKLCYVGSGIFAVFLVKDRGAESEKFVEVRRIAYPQTPEKPQWQKDLLTCSMNDYKPDPQPLYSLYNNMKDFIPYFDS